MSRIRTVKPDFFRHEGLYEAEVATALPLRIAFVGLWTVADREGRFRWRPRELKLDCLPYDDVDFSRVLDALASREFVVKYEVNGEHFGWIPTFAKHQVVNVREKPSSLPDPNENNDLTRAARVENATTTRHVHAHGEREEEGERKNNDDGKAREPLVCQEAIDLADEVARIVGHDPNHPPPQWYGAAMHVSKWLREGWTRDVILVAVNRTKGKSRDGPPLSIRFFEREIASEVARQAAPLPKVTIAKQTEIRTHGPDPIKANYREAVAELGDYIERLREDGDVREAPVRLLPSAGRG